MLETREKLGLEELEDTDLIPIINYAWRHSFARKEKNTNAISDQGWNRFNRNILTQHDLRATMTLKEKSREHHVQNNIILLNNFSKNISEEIESTIAVSTNSCSDFSVNTAFLTAVNGNINLPYLNFSFGTLQKCLNAIVKEIDLQRARERKRRISIMVSRSRNN